MAVSWWRVLGNPFLALPHAVWAAFLLLVLVLVTFLAWWAILFTGKYPPSLFKFSVGTLRYYWRLGSFNAFMHDRYPPFGISARSMDDQRFPATLSVYYPRRLSRLLLFFKWLAVIPALVFWFITSAIGALLSIFAYFVVLITSKWTERTRGWLVGVQRWMMRIVAYVMFLTDQYPGLRLRK